MKSNWLLLPLLLVTTFSVAQTIGDKVNAVTNELDKALTKRIELQAANKPVDAMEEDIDSGVLVFKKYRDSHEAQVDNLNQRATALNTQVEQHNSNRCVAPSDNPGACAAYNAEAAHLTEQMASLTNEDASLQKTAELIEQLKQTLTEKTMKWAAAKQQNISDTNENEANITRLRKTLTELRHQYEDCRDALKDKRDGALENSHAVCGAMFDGNKAR
jgi:chromosome segregation ATPase